MSSSHPWSLAATGVQAVGGCECACVSASGERHSPCRGLSKHWQGGSYSVCRYLYSCLSKTRWGTCLLLKSACFSRACATRIIVASSPWGPSTCNDAGTAVEGSFSACTSATGTLTAGAPAKRHSSA